MDDSGPSAEQMLWDALRHWRFMAYWKIDGMNIEQARIHTEAWLLEAREAIRKAAKEQA